uniref:Uncharacterized protein n=1 Tax=Taeniopygia guttata TaxID=59729 RepID=A0A674GVL8_TAEGU
PEVVKGELHGEKADMATLSPPVYSTNMPSLATKVFTFVRSTSHCLTPDAEACSDIVVVSSLLSDVMMKYLDVLSTSHLMLEKKLDWERRQTQQYFMEKNYEKLSLHHSSSRTASCKSEFSENTDLPEKTYEAILVEDDRTMEKGRHYEIDIVDNTSCSSSSNLEESAIAALLILLLSPTVTAGIAVSQRKVCQISDPVQQILIQLHKIIFSTQLPPALQCNLKSRINERFKKSHFSRQNNPCKLKSENPIYYLWSSLSFHSIMLLILVSQKYKCKSPFSKGNP